jgi:hypothetical protein
MHNERPLLRLTPRVRGKSWKHYVIGPLVLIAVGPFVLAYKLLFGWWLNPILDWHLEKKLRTRARTDLWFLFQDFDGRFVRNERPNKYATLVTIEAADLRVVVSQHHGDYGISVARRDRRQGSESLDSILRAIYEQEGSRREPMYVNLADLGELFRKKFNQVQIALSDEHYPDTLASIDTRHRKGMQEMAQGFNRPDGLFEADLVNPDELVKKAPK